MSRMTKLRALSGATLAAGVFLASIASADAQMLNQPIIRPPTPIPGTTLSPGQQMQFQSYQNALTNQAREQQSLGGAAGAAAELRTERQLNNLQLQRLQRE
jgi:hypothetical protein